MNNEDKNISNDFVDINESKNNSYIWIVVTLYVFVIILTVLLILNIRLQKKVVQDNLNNNEEINIPSKDTTDVVDDTSLDLNEEDTSINNTPADEDTANNDLESNIYDYLR